MFNISQSVTASRLMGRVPLVQVARADFSIFDYFKQKTDADESAAQDKKQAKAVDKVNSAVNAGVIPQAAADADAMIPKSTELRQSVRELERQGDNNMFGAYKNVRKTTRERNQNLEAEVEVQQRAGFGLHTQVPQGPANQQEVLQNLSFKELR